jgi:hypothetical protein
MDIAQKFRRPFRTDSVGDEDQTLRVWLIFDVAPRPSHGLAPSPCAMSFTCGQLANTPTTVTPQPKAVNKRNSFNRRSRMVGLHLHKELSSSKHPPYNDGMIITFQILGILAAAFLFYFSHKLFEKDHWCPV